jgi:hypothetical protein
LREYQHIEISPLSGEFQKPKKTPKRFNPYTPANRDKEEFYQTEIKRLGEISSNFQKVKGKFESHFEPYNIFKIALNQSVPEESFRQSLGAGGIEVLEPSYDKNGYWVTLSDDLQFTKFKDKLLNNSKKEAGKSDYIDAIKEVSFIKPEEKLGEFLREKPFQQDEIGYVDVSIRYMKKERLDPYLNKLMDFIEDNNGTVADVFRTQNLCLLRVLLSNKLLKDLLDETSIARIDRPPNIRIENLLESMLPDFEISDDLPDNLPEVHIVDSGLRHHPLLKNAIGTEISVSQKNANSNSDTNVDDDVGHGTMVGSIAVYGDITTAIKTQKFIPQIRIHSSKVMYKNKYGEPEYDEKELLETQLSEAVIQILDKHPGCKIVNLSLGNSANQMYDESKQFDLALLIDELTYKYQLIFVIAAGNSERDISKYPEVLLSKTKDRRIIDPGTASLAITVGSIYSRIYQESLSDIYFPSPITRVGPGLQGMIKPEIVELGGGGYGEETDVVVFEPHYIKKGRLFSLVCGTSFSAPKVSHYLAKLVSKFPNGSINLIKALLLSSAEIPRERPGKLQSFKISDPLKNSKHLLNIYGYGKPNLEKALNSFSNSVVLLHDGSIRVKRVQLFPIYLPAEFVQQTGDRNISVTLVYTPSINKETGKYHDVTIDYHLFKNISIEKVSKSYNIFEMTPTDSTVPPSLKSHKLKMHPGSSIRRRGVHQKGTAVFSKKPEIDVKDPLILAVICQQNRSDIEYEDQPFSVIVRIEHSKEIDLYSEIRLKNQIRLRV